MSDIKHCFTSRFEGGLIVEADFSQLEVIGAGMLSEDPVLEQDLLDGRDMHRYYTAQRLGITEEEVTKPERTKTKRMSFQLQYGSGAGNMAKKIGVKKEQAELFIQQYYERYSRLAEWQNTIFEAVKRSRKPTAGRTASGLPQGRGEYRSATGRLYVFLEKDKPEGWKGRDKEPDFNPPEIKNYPIQGFATGDVMAVFRGKMYRRWLADPELFRNALPINTVHDSVMFDCRTEEIARKIARVMKEEAAKLPAFINQTWGIKAILPLKIEVSAGPSWATTEPLLSET